MYSGTTSKEILSHLLTILNKIKPKRLFIPFAGNFIVEQACRNSVIAKELEIHSTDVSTYSNLLGFGIVDKNHEIKLKPAYEPYFDFIPEKTIEDYGVIAMVANDLGSIIKNCETIPYYKGLMRDYNANKHQYFLAAKKKYIKVKNVLNSGPFAYYGIDALELLKKCKEGDLVYLDAPFKVGEYEAKFKDMEEMFYGNGTKYTDITPKVIEDTLFNLHNSGAMVIYKGLSLLTDGGEIAVPDNYDLIHKSLIKEGVSFNLYSNLAAVDKRAHNLMTINEKVVNYKLIGEDFEITYKTKVNIVKVQNEVLNHYRLMWIKKAQMVSGGGTSYLFFLDDCLIGGCQMISGRQYGFEMCLLMTDPVCPFSKYKRLSKLLTALIATKQFVDRFSKDDLWEHEGIYTRVFSDNQMSMKYRGIYEKRLVEETGEGHKMKYAITYECRNEGLFPTFKAALGWWVQKFAKETVKTGEAIVED